MANRPVVEYQKLRPRQVVERREAKPVAYIGLGILEWHGLHNPLGLDGIKANGIACYLAERHGGIVMPPQYWGDNRQEICERHLDAELHPLPEVFGTIDHAAHLCETMKLSKEAFARDAERSRLGGDWELWERLVVHTLFQIETLGFKMIVPIPGHYPLVGPLQNAVNTYKERGGTCRIFSLTDNLAFPDGPSGDHAAAFETSLTMALEPHLVDLSELDEDLTKPNVGVVLGPDPRTHANREYGMEILKRFEQIIGEQISLAGL